MESNQQVNQKKVWVEPSIEKIDIARANALPGTGADAGGNQFPDCQRS